MCNARWSYMRYEDGSEELYDMSKDPKQLTNLANSIDAGNLMSEIRSAFDTRITEIR